MHAGQIAPIVSVCAVLLSLSMAIGATTSPSNSGAVSELKFYTAQDQYTDPGDEVAMFDGIDHGIESAVLAVEGVLIHAAHAWRYPGTRSAQAPEVYAVRPVSQILKLIRAHNPRPISQPRDPSERALSNCRTYAVLLCSVLRHQGTPARVRCGYASYFTPGKYENHWICEYWNLSQSRWVRVDAQLDEVLRKGMKIDFDSLDLPSGKFIAGPEAWRLYRDQRLDPQLVGIGQKDGYLLGQSLLPWDPPASMKGRPMRMRSRLTRSRGSSAADRSI
jgi:hypothetical protein